MFGLNPAELTIVGAVACLLFGDKLPDAWHAMGKGLTGCKNGMPDAGKELRRFGLYQTEWMVVFVVTVLLFWLAVIYATSTGI